MHAKVYFAHADFPHELVAKSHILSIPCSLFSYTLISCVGIAQTFVTMMETPEIRDIGTKTETINVVISVTRPRPRILDSRLRLGPRPRLNANNCDVLWLNQWPSMEIKH